MSKKVHMAVYAPHSEYASMLCGTDQVFMNADFKTTGEEGKVTCKKCLKELADIKKDARRTAWFQIAQKKRTAEEVAVYWAEHGTTKRMSEPATVTGLGKRIVEALLILIAVVAALFALRLVS